MVRICAGAVVTMLLLGATAANAAEQRQPPQKPPQPSILRTPPPVCDTQDSAEYVPGVDVHGKPVAPADIPGGSNVIVNTEVYPQIRTRNPQIGSVGVDVQIDGLGAPPRCQPPPLRKAKPPR